MSARTIQSKIDPVQPLAIKTAPARQRCCGADGRNEQECTRVLRPAFVHVEMPLVLCILSMFNSFPVLWSVIEYFLLLDSLVAAR
jgi:hypothetical protein